MKNIVFCTGTRADFGKLKVPIRAFVDSGVSIKIYVTGMHMIPEYGLTSVEVLSEFPAAICRKNCDYGDGQAKQYTNTVLQFGEWLSSLEVRPDYVIVHGDRVESLAIASICAVQRIRVCHIEGGERSGVIDEMIRHAITKLSHAHFVANVEARERVLRLGENSCCVYTVGSPELDIHNCSEKLPSLDEVTRHYEIDSNNYGIVIYHPNDRLSAAQSLEEAVTLFECCASSGKYFVVIRPNNDPGSEAIMKIVDNLPANNFCVRPSLRFEYFCTLMRNAQLFIGNSSVGVREAPFLGINSINIGHRQAARHENAESIVHVENISSENLSRLIDSKWGQRCKTNESFGVGDTYNKLKSVVGSESFWSIPFDKNLTY